MLKMDGSAVPNGARADTQKTQGPDGRENVALVEGNISGYDFGEWRYPPDSVTVMDFSLYRPVSAL
jgi:hypothetical protein